MLFVVLKTSIKRIPFLWSFHSFLWSKKNSLIVFFRQSFQRRNEMINFSSNRFFYKIRRLLKSVKKTMKKVVNRYAHNRTHRRYSHISNSNFAWKMKSRDWLINKPKSFGLTLIKKWLKLIYKYKPKPKCKILFS